MQISGLSASNTFSATDVLAIEVSVNGVQKTYKLTGATLAAALASIGSYLTTADVVNSLTSTSTTAPLSANMGKELNDKITSIVHLFAISETTSASGKIAFSNLSRTKAILLPGSVNAGYGNVSLIPCYISGDNWGYQVSDGANSINNTLINGIGYYIDI